MCVSRLPSVVSVRSLSSLKLNSPEVASAVFEFVVAHGLVIPDAVILARGGDSAVYRGAVFMMVLTLFGARPDPDRYRVPSVRDMVNIRTVLGAMSPESREHAIRNLLNPGTAHHFEYSTTRGVPSMA